MVRISDSVERIGPHPDGFNSVSPQYFPMAIQCNGSQPASKTLFRIVIQMFEFLENGYQYVLNEIRGIVLRQTGFPSPVKDERSVELYETGPIFRGSFRL